MALGHMRPDLVQAGHRLAKEFDDVGLCPAVAAWTREHKVGEWRYYILSSMVGIIQKKRVQRVARHIMEIIDLPNDLCTSNIYIAGLNSQHLIDIGKKFKFVGDSPIYLGGIVIGKTIMDAVVYRFNTRQRVPKSRDIRKFIAFERQLDASQNDRKPPE